MVGGAFLKAGMKNILTAEHTHWLLLTAILALGLALRLTYLSSNVHAPDFNSPVLDPQLNDYWARALVTGDWTPPPHAEDPEIRTTPYGRPPGYPWLLAVMYWISDGSYLVPRLVQVCIGLVNILLVFLLKTFWEPFRPDCGVPDVRLLDGNLL